MSQKTYVTDISHFNSLNLPIDAPAKALRFAQYLSAIVSVATSIGSGKEWATGLKCRCRPNRQPCTGRLKVIRKDVPAEINWFCPKCGENGVITNWKGSSYDLSAVSNNSKNENCKVIITDQEYQVLINIITDSKESDRIIMGARRTQKGMVLSGSIEDIELLINCVAAEANHETRKKRQSILDRIFSKIDEELNQFV